MRDGISDGDPLGSPDGAGDTDGSELVDGVLDGSGDTDGSDDVEGTIDGLSLGELLGIADGEMLGELLGVPGLSIVLGEPLGVSDGVDEGSSDGELDGSSEDVGCDELDGTNSSYSIRIKMKEQEVLDSLDFKGKRTTV